MKENLHILKIGGNVIENEKILVPILQAFAKKPGKKIIVHGGGKKATSLADQLGVKSVFVDGRRVTDKDSLEIAVMVYAGWYNKKMVSLCHALGLPSLGLSGADANAILSQKRVNSEIDYGWVGDPISVNTHDLTPWLNQNLTLIFCAVTHDGNGQLLNTNADTIASFLATSFADIFQVDLSFCLELPGVLQDISDLSSVIPSLDQKSFLIGKEKGYFHSGMIPKLENAFKAISLGVNKVIICGPESFITNGGTHIVS